MTKLNAYHVAFTFDQPTPGVITIPAATKDEASKKLADMANDNGIKNLNIKEVIDIEDIPHLKAIIDQQSQAMADAQAMLDEHDTDNKKEETKVVN